MGRFLEKRTWGYYSHPLGISWDCNGMWQLSLDISNADISLDIRKAMIFGRVSQWGISLKWGLVIFMDIMIIYDLPVDYLQRNPTVHHDRQQCFFVWWVIFLEENRGESRRMCMHILIQCNLHTDTHIYNILYIYILYIIYIYIYIYSFLDLSTFLKRSTWTWPRPEHWTIHAGRCPHNFGHRYIAFGSRLEEIRWGRIRDKVGEGGWSSSGFVGSFPGGKTQFNLSISVVFLWRFSVEKKPKTPRNGALGNRWDWDSFHMVTMGFWHRPSPDITRYHQISPHLPFFTSISVGFFTILPDITHIPAMNPPFLWHFSEASGSPKFRPRWRARPSDTQRWSRCWTDGCMGSCQSFGEAMGKYGTSVEKPWKFLGKSWNFWRFQWFKHRGKGWEHRRKWRFWVGKSCSKKGHISWAENVGFKRWRPGRDGEDVVPEKIWEPRLSAFLFGVTMNTTMKTSS